MARRKVIKDTNNVNILNILLFGVVIVMLYQLVDQYQINQSEMVVSEPETIIKEKIIYKTIEKQKDEEPYRENVYIPDIRRVRPPFNYHTRGAPEEYDMVGFLQDTTDSNKLQQLYGRRTYPNSNNWNYFVKSDQYHQIPIPVTIDGKNCTDETGCKELSNQDTINVLGGEQVATIYKPEPYVYNPYRI